MKNYLRVECILKCYLIFQKSILEYLNKKNFHRNSVQKSYLKIIHLLYTMLEIQICKTTCVVNLLNYIINNGLQCTLILNIFQLSRAIFIKRIVQETLPLPKFELRRRHVLLINHSGIN